jgi:hypothetical protein
MISCGCSSPKQRVPVGRVIAWQRLPSRRRAAATVSARRVRRDVSART